MTLQGNCAIVHEGLDRLPVFALEHHIQVFPSGFSVINFFCINFEGFQVIYASGVDDFPVLQLLGGVKVEILGFPVGGLIGNHCNRNWVMGLV